MHFISDIVWAVGKFHLGAHKDICYPNFSLNHKEGSGQVDGETMEPLWSKLNAATITARAMSLAHREEYIMLIMLDMNWKVIIRFSKILTLFSTCIMRLTMVAPCGLADTSKKKLLIAIESYEGAKEAFEKLSSSNKPEHIAMWKEQEMKAKNDGGDSLLKLYFAQIEKSQCKITCICSLDGLNQDLALF